MANPRTTITPTRAGSFQVRYFNKGGIAGNNGTVRTVKPYAEMPVLDPSSPTGKKLFKSKKLAEHIAKEWEHDQYAMMHNGAPSRTSLNDDLEEIAESYLDAKRDAQKGWKTVKHYQMSLEALLRDNSLSTLGDLMNLDFHKWVKDMRERKRSFKDGSVKIGFAPQTIWGLMNDTRMFCTWLVKKGKIAKSPFPEDAMPPKVQPRARFYTDHEWETLEPVLAQINRAAYIGVQLAHDYGLREVEIVGDGAERLEGVLWEDITFHDDGTADLFLRPEVTKGGKGPRNLRLSGDFLKLIGPKQTGPLVPLKRATFWNYFKRARTLSGVNPKLTIHGQRHTFAKDLLQKTGVNMKVVRDLLGHKDAKTTEIYSHLEQSFLDNTMEKLHQARSANGKSGENRAV